MSKATKLPKPWTRKVTLNGITDIMFDRYAGDNNTTLRTDQKMYLDSDNRVTVPATNVMSLLSAQNTPSAPKRFLDSRQYKKAANAILSFVSIEPFEIPLLRDEKEIVFTGLDENGEDKQAGIYTSHKVARLEKGIPHPKERPVLKTPWTLKMLMRFFPNDEITEEMVQNLLIRGGVAIGLGTYRGVYGKFSVDEWE